MTNQQIIQLVIFALLMGASGIGWVLRKLAEQAQRRAALQEIERRRMEAFRTGRDPSAATTSVEAPAATRPGPIPSQADGPSSIAERRRLQLEELRRRQIARAAGVGGAPQPQAPAMPRSIPGSSGPTVSMPSRQGPRASAPRPMPQQRPAGRDRSALPSQVASAAEAARREAIKRQQERANRKLQEQSRAETAKRSAQRADEASESTTQRRVKDAETTEAVYAVSKADRGGPAKDHTSRPFRTGKLASIEGQEMTLKEWRRALIVSEILSEPVSLRGM